MVGFGICLGFGGYRRSSCRPSGFRLGICPLLGLGLGLLLLLGLEGPVSGWVSLGLELGVEVWGLAVGTLTYSLT